MVLQEIPSVPNMICQLEDAFVPTLRVLLRAPHSSPLFEVDKQHIAAFILQLCRSCESTVSSINISNKTILQYSCDSMAFRRVTHLMVINQDRLSDFRH